MWMFVAWIVFLLTIVLSCDSAESVGCDEGDRPCPSILYGDPQGLTGAAGSGAADVLRTISSANSGGCSGLPVKLDADGGNNGRKGRVIEDDDQFKDPAPASTLQPKFLSTKLRRIAAAVLAQ